MNFSGVKPVFFYHLIVLLFCQGKLLCSMRHAGFESGFICWRFDIVKMKHQFGARSKYRAYRESDGNNRDEMYMGSPPEVSIHAHV